MPAPETRRVFRLDLKTIVRAIDSDDGSISFNILYYRSWHITGSTESFDTVRTVKQLKLHCLHNVRLYSLCTAGHVSQPAVLNSLPIHLFKIKQTTNLLKTILVKKAYT